MKRLLPLLFISLGSFLASSRIQAQVLQGIIAINNGSSITNDKEGRVVLKIFAKGAAQMRISNNGSFAGARWQPYETQVNWRIDPSEDGIKTVYAQFRDASGSIISETAIAQIELDTKPPTNCFVTIAGGAEYTNAPDRKVFLELGAEDVHQMRISNRSDFLNARWYPFRSQISDWYLAGGEGTRYVYAQFKDMAGNLSEIVSDTIIVDNTPPQQTGFKINGGALFTTKREVKLQFQAEGAAEIAIMGESEWIPYTNEVEYTLPDEDKEHVVAVKFKDKMGNQSKPSYGRIRLDRQAPQNPKVVINGGNKYTKSHRVNVRLAAIEAYEIKVSNQPDLRDAEWRAYTYQLPAWTFHDATDGTKTIYVKFRDRAGNETEVITDDIILDQQAPSNPQIAILTKEGKEGYTSNKEGLVDLKLNAEDARYMMISNAANFFEGKWEIYRERVDNWKLSGGSGEKQVFVKFRDKAGNITAPVSAKVVLDLEPPVDTRLVINKMAKYTNHPEGKVELHLFARGATEYAVSNSDSFEGAKWEKMTEQPVTWQLDKPSVDGLKKVSARYRDESGNESQSVTAEIILDRKPPYDINLLINRGDTITNHPNKRVILQTSAQEATQMIISSSSDFSNSRWFNYVDGKNINYILPGDDGLKEVHVKFRDEAGNETEPVMAKILLKRTPPIAGTVKINDGDNGTNFQEVTLTLNAQGAHEMMLSNRIDFPDAKWEPFQPSRKFVLQGEDGVKFVFVRYRDKAGNVSEIIFDRIGLDRTAPTEGSISINKGAKYTTQIDGKVMLQFRAKGAVEMRVGNSEKLDSAKWQPFREYLQYYLPSEEDGEKTVWVQFGDKVGNFTKPISAKIILDRQPPYGEEIVINGGEPHTNNRQVKIAVTAKEASEMIISNTRHFSPPSRWQPYKGGEVVLDWTLTGADGYKSIYAKFRDEAGNESFATSSQILLDTEPPIPGLVKINGGMPRTKDTHVKLTLNARQADFMMISNSFKFDGAVWEEYKAQVDWVLDSATPGYKRVYVKFKDYIGNETAPIFAEISFDAL
jgi:hypothetical protein